MSVHKQKRGSLSFFLLFVLLIPALGTIAQDSAEPPPRQVDRVAPEREAVILQQQTLPDGTINTVIEIPASADTYLASERPEQNFGNDALFLGYNLVGEDNYGAQRILLYFDLDAHLPEQAIIHSGFIRLRLSFSSPPDDTPMGTVMRRLASPWNEHTVTWNTEPNWTPVDKTAFVGSQLDWYEWDITEVVDDWVQDVYANDGVEIIGDEAVQQRERAFHSRETTTGFYPRLVVDYSISDDTQPPITTMNPLPEYSRRNFTVSWSGDDPGGSGISHYDVQVRVDSGEWQNWLEEVTVTEAEYVNGENGRTYEFRVRAVDNAGNEEAFGPAEAQTVVDSQPPTSTIEPLPSIIQQNSFTVSWSGADNGAGIQYYDVQYRYGNGPWQIWLPQTLATSATFSNATDGLYAFEVRAVDNVGNVEAFINQAEASIIVDAVPPFVEPRARLPVVFKQ